MTTTTTYVTSKAPQLKENECGYWDLSFFSFVGRDTMDFLNEKILEIEQTSDPTIIRAAFNKLAMQYHPDRNIGDASAEVMMKILNEAIAVL